MVQAKPNGLMVVRVPEESVQGVPTGGGQHLPAVGPIMYRGVDRMAWWDVGNLCYEQPSAPQWLRTAYDRVTEPVPGTLCLSVCTDLDLTRRLLEASNATGHRNEVIAVRSEVLGDMLDGKTVGDVRSTWRGFDPYLIGEFSLLRAGLFSAPETFKDWISAVNEHGLFDSADRAEEYVGAYLERAGAGQVEPLPQDPDVDIVEVGTVS